MGQLTPKLRRLLGSYGLAGVGQFGPKCLGQLTPKRVGQFTPKYSGLLINIVATAVLSLPSPFQQQAFNQLNIAILYFPFVWLPSVVVPVVLLAHVSAIRQLIRKGSYAV